MGVGMVQRLRVQVGESESGLRRAQDTRLSICGGRSQQKTVCRIMRSAVWVRVCVSEGDFNVTNWSSFGGG